MIFVVIWMLFGLAGAALMSKYNKAGLGGMRSLLAIALLSSITNSDVALAQGIERAVGSVQAFDGDFDILATDRGRVLLTGRSGRDITLEFPVDSLRRWLSGPAVERSLLWVLSWHGRLQGAEQLTVRSAFLGTIGTTGTLQVERQLFSSGSICNVWLWGSDSSRKMKILTSASQMLRLRSALLQATGVTDSLTKRRE